VLAILFIAGIALAIMSVVLQVRAAQKSTVQFQEVWNDFKHLWWRIILVEITVAILIIAGLIALILPGIYLIGRLLLAPYILVAEDTRVFEALERSWALTKGRMGQVYNIFLLAIVLSLFNLIPVIGSAIAVVLTVAYSVVLPLRYLELKKLS